ncbi:lipase-like PAD4 [Neltuma alba]|uniref:lipase-like PAD4 n=1 Tax=Neltuma alba TaxID=207710 RepID=UPI0010A540DD|nr:lipase-like PAD4 [Prosopis alba]
MDTETSPFESSDMLAAFLLSTPLIPESWRLCSLANTAASGSFLTEQIGDAVYLAFSGIQMAGGSGPSWGQLVPLVSVGDVTLFSSHPSKEGEDSVMVHKGMLNLFWSIFKQFQNQMMAIMGNPNTKSIIITGHSLGGAIASLCTIWLLSYLQSISSSMSVLCITYGSPLLGNESLSKAILKERWGGNFCHVVSKHDIMPRLLFAPIIPLTTQIYSLLQFWQFCMTSPHLGNFGAQISDQEKADIFTFVMAYLDNAASQDGERTLPVLFHPFGSYFFVSDEGAVCVDGTATVIKMMHLMLATSSPASCIKDHLKYGDYVNKLSQQSLNQRNSMQVNVPDSSYEAGLELALQSSGITSRDPAASPFRQCLSSARRKGRTPTLNAANLAVTLSKFVPYRAEIEWYKAWCDKSDDELGYYDSFKRRGSTTAKRDMKVNMNRHKLARFWNNVIEMLENNELPRDFNKRAKWVNASHSYQLLVEPLDIAEYYGKEKHKTNGHYLERGRDRRYKIFDRWWMEKEATMEETKERTKFAGLTQDSCFWAKVEEARDWLSRVRSERDVNKQVLLWQNIEKFEKYAVELIESKAVSEDVLAKNSSYSLWVEELREVRELNSKVRTFPNTFTRFLDGEVVP